jgi:hypothetical protein
VTKVESPKNEIASLHGQSARAHEPVRLILIEIAQALDVSRCHHSRRTGFQQFVEDVRDEVGPLVE